MTSVLVLGAGPAGMLTAAAVAPFVDDVVVLEQDRLAGPSARRGVPQSTQLHNLLHPAHSVADRLAPGFVDELLGAGATRTSVAGGTHVHELGRRMPERDLGMFLMSARRPVIDAVLHRLVGQLPNVTVRDNARVAGLILDQRRVRGVMCDQVGAGLEADVVVDALGATSPVASWLAEAGVGVSVEARPVAQWYCSSELEVPHGVDARHTLVFPSPPASRGGLASPTGDGALVVSVSGTAQDPSPTDAASFLAYAASLEDPAIYELLRRCRFRSGPRRFCKTHSVWRHYEAGEAIAGLLPVGDAYATLNPLQGQGLSVAALQAAIVRDRAEASPVTADACPDLVQRLAVPIRWAWDLAALAGPPGEMQIPWDDLVALGRCFDSSEILHRRYLRVWHLLEPVGVLVSPEVRALVEQEDPMC